MDDINGISTEEYLGPTFSIDMHDRDGDAYDNGIWLHYGPTAIRVARTLRGFKAHIKHLEGMVWEITENLS